MSSYAYGGKSKDVDEATKSYTQKQSDTTGKIIIFTLSGLCILVFIFISIGYFFIAKPLNASLTSVALTNLNYNNNNTSSSSFFFNATLTMFLRIQNPNFGFFEFPTSKGDILYNDQVVGEMKINGRRVDSFSVIRTEIKTEVSYRENQTLKNDIERGIMILKTRARLRGKVHMKVLNKRIVNLKCLMHIDLLDHVIQRLWCK